MTEIEIMPDWISLTYPKPTPLPENHAEACIMHEVTQPSQTCFGGFTNT